MSPLESSGLHRQITWTHTGPSERTPDNFLVYRATVDGASWQLRMNDFPAEDLYTLIVNGEDVTSFNNWPSIWIRPDDHTTPPVNAAPAAVQTPFSVPQTPSAGFRPRVRSVEQILSDLKSGTSHQREQAAKDLLRKHPVVLPQVVQELEGSAEAGDVALRLLAARCLGAIAGVRPDGWNSVPPSSAESRQTVIVCLLLRLGDGDERVRACAAMTLGKMHAFSAVPRLGQVLLHDPSERVADQCASALGQLIDHPDSPALLCSAIEASRAIAPAVKSLLGCSVPVQAWALLSTQALQKYASVDYVLRLESVLAVCVSTIDASHLRSLSDFECEKVTSSEFDFDDPSWRRIDCSTLNQMARRELERRGS